MLFCCDFLQGRGYEFAKYFKAKGMHRYRPKSSDFDIDSRQLFR